MGQGKMIAAFVRALLDEFPVDQQGPAVQVEKLRALGVVVDLDVHLTAGREAQCPAVHGQRVVLGVQVQQVVDQELRLDHIHLLIPQRGQPFIGGYEAPGDGLDVFSGKAWQVDSSCQAAMLH